MDEDKNVKRERIYKVVMLVILTMFITYMVTALAFSSKYMKNPVTKLVGINNDEGVTESNIDKYIDNIKDIINKNYLWNSDIDNQELINSAVEGYVSGLNDKYSEYIPKDEMEEFTSDITGNFTGIGVYMVADETTQKILVYYPIPESPAEAAGLKSGDIILTVDGKEYAFEEFSTLAEDIRGPEGTKVKVGIERDGKNLEFEITRAKVTTNPIMTKMLNKTIGYIKVPSFDSQTSTKFQEKMDNLISDGAKSVIIDLRNNGGGIVDESVNIADYFLEKNKKIMITKDNNGKEEIEVSKNNPKYEIPVVLLVNENTASASEILTGALKDNKRATVIGTKTYGKGVIQTVYTLSDGSGLKLTTAEYLTPSRSTINKVGIEPDKKIELSKDITNIYALEEKDDVQLQKAIEELK